MYKKYTIGFTWPYGLIHKIWMIMRISVILLIVGLLHVSAAGWAQRISLSQRRAPLSEVFAEINQQTGYNFLWFAKRVDNNFPVDVNLKNADIKTAMTQLFKGLPLSYTIQDKTILVKEKESPSTVTITLSGTKDNEATNTSPQQLVIAGQVTDTLGHPLPNATVKIKGTNISIVTNELGRYRLTVPTTVKNPVLVFTSVGMKPLEIPYSGNNLINAVLRENVESLDDVVVTGIFNKNKETYTGSARVISEVELKQFQGRNIFTTIGNIDPSFYVVPDNNFGSDPNHIPEVQLRGNRNLPNINQLQDQTAVTLNTPLIIIDGFESTMERMMDLNNNQIQSITLLKDGSATAMYGSRGANGIIVITTKAPIAGKLKLYYNAGMNLSLPDLSSYHLLNAKDKLELERISGFYYNPTMTADQNIGLQQYYNEILARVNSGVNTDWLAKPLRTQIDQKHELRLEGGDQAFRYQLGVQYNNINGVMKGSDRRTVNGNIGLSYQLNKLNFRNNTIITFMNSNESPWGSFADYAKLNPYWSPYDADGQIGRYFSPFDKDYSYNANGSSYAIPNPMYDATINTYDKSGYTNITNNFQLDWRPEPHLLLQGTIGLTSLISSSDDFKPASHSSFASYSASDILRKGSYAYNSGKEFDYNGTLRASYTNIFKGVHQVTGGIQVDLSQNQNRNFIFNAEGFPDETIDFLGMALQYQQDGKPGGSEATTRRIGVLGNMSYAYDNRYLADVSYRIDGASQFGSDRLFAPFWSGGLGWNLHNEHFIKDNLPFINRLKLRASFGVTGNQAFGAYLPLATYSYITNDQYHGWLGATQTALGNPNLQWQKSGKTDFGFESEWLNSRLSFQADYYIEKTSNLLSSLELPYANGFSNYIENIGKLQQHGIELATRVVVLQNTQRRFYWSVSANIVYNTDKIVQLSEAMKAANEQLALQQDLGSNTPNKIIREGASQNTIYAVRSLGIDPSTGKELFLNKDGEVTYTWTANDRVAVGVDQPKYRGNLSTTLNFDNLMFSASFGYRFGGQLYNQTLIDKVENADRLFNVDNRVFYDRWQKPGDVTFFRGINETLKVNPSSRFVQNENTFSCQSVSMQYNINNRHFLHKLGLESLMVGANCGELFYFSTVKQERGLDYPYTRQFNISLNAIF
ncbi:TonB-linked outer membrane protein, SusC/RagA family [bacterium A37T11]|nr:TonB-linked outer membrane protein, SusC/RagA family [bacterium A37T11]